ncbi:hypothetical protein GCM10023232_12330 [Sphingosinicella ginsenosidimutans]|uniref:MarR family transcriptional regulator n=1 Tax=Allosphingosinicella ginsenosidimutans TaxID=1176539 RepID=A0A5C6TRL6_9SPHN|nr:MarR family transcriptional regulator [Sphingosinicella ginsenosidimutans]TXC62338.1 MarR family transcriptional regulator [Sphingosinicella ginsenosidimutans]
MREDVLAMIEYRDQPSILVFADSDQAQARAREAVAAADCRIAAMMGPAEALTQLDRCAADVVYAEIAEGGDEAWIAPLLDRLVAEAGAGRRSVIALPGALLDLAAARAWHSGVDLLPDPDEAERAAALSIASHPPAARLNDVSRQGNALLHQLSEEAARIANILANLSGDEAGGETEPAPAEEDEPAMSAPQIRAIIRARRMRDQFFRGELFADPAWDMLLDLMAARLEQSRVAVSSLCIAAAVPATTALRWIKALTDRDIFIRSADPRDGRRVYIELSDEAARALNAYLRAIQRIAPAVI